MTALPGANVIPSEATARVSSTRRASPVGYLRLILVPLWTALGIVVLGVARIGPGGVRRKRRIVRGWARGLLRLLRIEVLAEGAPPTPPFLLVSNHLSYLDIIVLASQTDAVFVAKREVRSWPVFGLGASAIGCIFVDRESRSDTVRVGDAMRDRHRAQEGVVLFAEGTSSEGSTVLPLRSSLLEWPAAEQLPVHTATLSYHTAPSDPPASESLCWWGDMTFLPHLIGVCRLGPSQARVAFGRATISASDRKALATLLHSALLADFRPSGAR
ncbi:MAG TPA: lysophospholipid acyltransferase family protein [Gemmatimonadales bacterium]|nr:lysophospholipid acyltransferase family protein [Gemmatimonadales bacterium]